MDVRAKAWMRAWLMGTAAAGIVTPSFLAAQSIRQPAPRPMNRIVQTSAKTPVGTNRTPVTQAAYVPTPVGDQVAQSEIEQRLREMYERDGREMPDMRLAPAPANPGVAAPQQASPPANLPRTQPTAQAQQYRPQPAQKPSGNKVTSFFKKMIPGGNKKAPAQAQTPPAPPTQRPYPQANQQPMRPGMPAQAYAQPQPVYQPPVQQQPQFVQQPTAQPPAVQQRPVGYQPVPQPGARPSIRAAATQETLFIPPSPADTAASSVSYGSEAAINNPVLAAPDVGEEQELITLPSPAGKAAVKAPASELNDLLDEGDDEFFEAPEMPALAAPSPQAAEDDPFAAPESSSASVTEEANPYTGKSLDEEPEVAKTSDDAKATPKVAEEPLDETTATKMRRIIQRADMKGLKGFCPVTLRDQRELADSRPEFVGSYRGQKFFFASKVAQTKFEQDPTRYAPAAYGADVVVLTDDQDVAEGSLDFAAWYKGRLYLFGNQENHDKFVESPEKYATPPGID